MLSIQKGWTKRTGTLLFCLCFREIAVRSMQHFFMFKVILILHPICILL